MSNKFPALFDFLGVQVVRVATLIFEGVETQGCRCEQHLWEAVHGFLKIIFLEKQSRNGVWMAPYRVTTSGWVPCSVCWQQLLVAAAQMGCLPCLVSHP